MAKKIFTYRGKTIEELQKLSIEEFAELLPSRERRSLKRGFDDSQKKILEEVKKGKKTIKTHERGILLLPSMVGITFKVHRGNTFETVVVTSDMIGNRLGSFAPTRKRLSHSSPGVGATKSSSAVSAK